MTHDDMNEEHRLRIQCKTCLHVYAVVVDYDAYWDWVENGQAVQKCFPELSAGDRELLISSTCDSCFKKLFPPEGER
jgi:hypothetical protein